MANSGQGCTTRCWGLAAIIGAMTFLVLLTAGNYSFIAAVFLGAVVAVLLGFLFKWLFCAEAKTSSAAAPSPAARASAPVAGAGAATTAGAAGAASAVGAVAAGSALAGDGAAQNTRAEMPEPAPKPQPEPRAVEAEPEPQPEPQAAEPAPEPQPEPRAAEAEPASAAGQTTSRVKPSAPLAGEADLDSRKGSWKYEREDKPAEVSDATPEAPAVAAPEPANPAPEGASPDSRTAQEVIKPSKALAGEQELATRKGSWRYEGPSQRSGAGSGAAADLAAGDADGVDAGADAGTRPAMLDAPKKGGPDNLKEIKGIGPKLEVLCHSLGVYHFDQIAAWTADEVAWMDANLEGFRGRVSRDEWVAQARILAAGGETEFSSRIDEGGDS